MFKCDWVDINRGCKKKKFDCTIVNFSYLAHTGEGVLDDPFVFASHAKKVFYVSAPKYKDWVIVKPVKVKDNYDLRDAHYIVSDHLSQQMYKDQLQPSDLIRSEDPFEEVVVQEAHQDDEDLKFEDMF